LQEQHAIKARDWLDASAEIENRIPIHAEDLPDDMPERVRRLWHLIPEIVSLQFNLLPLNLEKDTLVLGMTEYDPDLAELAAAFSGYRIEVRLMEEELIHALQEDARAASGAAAAGGWKPLALGDFLAQSALVQRSQLAEITDEEKKQTPDLESALLQANLLNEIDLAEIYSLMSGIPYLTLEYFQLDESITGLLPADWALEQRVLPLFEREGDLWVGVADLKSCDMLGQAAERCGKRVWPVLVPRTALAAALNRCYQFNAPRRSRPKSTPWRPHGESCADLAGGSRPDRCSRAERKMPFDQAVLEYGKVEAAVWFLSWPNSNKSKIFHWNSPAHAKSSTIPWENGARTPAGTSRWTPTAPGCWTRQPRGACAPFQWGRMKTACVWRSPTRSLKTR
jgi:hypothetical protein